MIGVFFMIEGVRSSAGLWSVPLLIYNEMCKCLNKQRENGARADGMPKAQDA